MSSGVVAELRTTGSPVAVTIPRLALLLVSPLAAFWLMQFKPVMQDGFLDPYFYTGYITNFQDMFARSGATYYGVRFGLILPGHLAVSLFGPIHGYFVLRYVLALVAGMPFYFLVRQLYGAGIALPVYVLLLTSPFFARTLLWDHPDAAGMPFLFAAVSLILLEHRRRYLVDAAAGASAALAINSNFFIVVPLLLYVAPTVVLSIARRETPMLMRRIAAAL